MQTREAIDIACQMLINLPRSERHKEAIIILSIVMKITKEQIILNDYLKLSDFQLSNYFAHISNRAKGYPTAYIRGAQEFWGLEFKINESTLIPRPDSETLVSAVLSITTNGENIIDLGTGSGCLLLSILSEFDSSFGVGVDISAKAIEVAKQNAINLYLQERTHFVHADWNDLLSQISNKFDILIANPPYVSASEMNFLQTEVKYEPYTALVGGIDGLSCYRTILSLAPSILHHNGLCFIEIGHQQCIQLLDLIDEHNYKLVNIIKDLAGIERVIVFNI